ncbi:MAG TPA: DMT family transporter [Geomonas sp.]|nr:DMT family transporter [Geomonas sp.]
MIDGNAIGAMAALGSAASWSLGAVLFNRLGESLSSFAMTLVKGAMSVALLALLTLLVGGYSVIGQEAFGYLALSGLLGIALSDTFFFAALKELGPRDIVLLATVGQVFTVVLAVVLLGERLPYSGWAGIGLILTGITVGMVAGPSEEGRSSVKGIVFGLISVLSMSISVILTKKGLEHVSTLYATTIRMLAGTLGMLVVGIATRRIGQWVSPFKESRLLWRFLAAVCVITFGGFWLAIVAFKYTTVAVANSLISTEPIFILPISAFVMREKVTAQAVAGAVIATVGVVVLCTSGAVAG